MPSSAFDQSTIQALIDRRSKEYGEAFNNRSVDGIMSWISKDIEFNDIGTYGSCHVSLSIQIFDH